MMHKAADLCLTKFEYCRQAAQVSFCTSDVLAKIGTWHGQASKVMPKLHEHSLLTSHKILTQREGEDRQSQV